MEAEDWGREFPLNHSGVSLGPAGMLVHRAGGYRAEGPSLQPVPRFPDLPCQISYAPWRGDIFVCTGLPWWRNVALDRKRLDLSPKLGILKPPDEPAGRGEGMQSG